MLKIYQDDRADPSDRLEALSTLEAPWAGKEGVLLEISRNIALHPDDRIKAAALLPKMSEERNQILLNFLPNPEKKEPLWVYACVRAAQALPRDHPRRELTLCELAENESVKLIFRMMAVKSLQPGPKKTAALQKLRKAHPGAHSLEGMENQEATDDY